jgi:hypothetical protein
MAWAAALVTTVVALICIAVEIPAPSKPHAALDPLAESGGILIVTVNALVAAAFAVLGALVVSRRPSNPIGWLLMLIGVSFVAIVASNEVYLRVYLVEGSAPVAAHVIMWVGNWAFLPAWVSAAVFLPLLFPTGSPPSTIWRMLAWFAAAMGLLAFLGTAFSAGSLDGAEAVVNPIGWDHAMVELAGLVGITGLLPAALAAIASLFMRYRRSFGIERQQLRWLAAAACLLPLGFVSSFVIGEYVWPVLLICLLVVAGAVATAMLRHRLYDIDVVINWTLVYSALTATLATCYIGVVLLFQLILRPWTERSDLTVAASTLIVAALFGPARRRIQRVVDRRFYRRRYDALRVVEAFSGRLRESLDLVALDADLRSVVRGTVQPTHVSIWLCPPRRPPGQP